MRHLTLFNVITLGLAIIVHRCSSQLPDENFDEWLVEVAVDSTAAEEAAKAAARLHDLELVRSISQEHFPRVFHLRAKKDAVDVNSVTRSLMRLDKVHHASFQLPHSVDMKSYSSSAKYSSHEHYFQSTHCRCHAVSFSQDRGISHDVFDAMNRKPLNLKEKFRFNDFRWPCQWQLYNCGQSGSPNEYDMDVVSVWNKGITGKGIVVAIVDDGVDYRHPEISPNYDPTASFDFIEYPDLDGPLPYWFKPHGTKCAGVVGMAANNTICGVGIAYQVKLAALRIMGTKSTYLREASGLIHKSNYIDIYSNSWGPTDSGKLFRKPESITLQALEIGCNKGRNGKGNLYTFASGNGGLNDDHCGADGFSCSIYTIAVGASTRNGKSARFSEQCTCILMTIPGTDFHTYGKMQWMIAPSLFNSCVNYFDGTSSTTPLASGVLAMILQANPNLTWRDVQYLIAETALVVDPHNSEWCINGAGYHINPYFGFGVLNALHIVEAAEHWENVDIQQKCALIFPAPYRVIPSGGKLTLLSRSNGCQNMSNQVLKLEHIQVILSYDVKCRGDISIRIKSPCGTVSPIMNTRRLDDFRRVIAYPYMSVFHWGEDPRGIWVLEIIDNKGSVPSCYRSSHEESAGHLFKYELVLWGVKESDRMEMRPPVCNKKFLFNYLNQTMPKDHHFAHLIKKDGEISTKQTIYYEFVEDFSPKTQDYVSSKLDSRPPGPNKVLPNSIAFEQVVNAKWQSTFPSVYEKASVLADYIMKGVSPNCKMDPRFFFSKRWLIAKKLEKAAMGEDDDGELQIRDDLKTMAMLLTNRRRDTKRVFPSKHDAQIIIASLGYIWN